MTCAEINIKRPIPHITVQIMDIDEDGVLRPVVSSGNSFTYHIKSVPDGVQIWQDTMTDWLPAFGLYQFDLPDLNGLAELDRLYDITFTGDTPEMGGRIRFRAVDTGECQELGDIETDCCGRVVLRAAFNDNPLQIYHGGGELNTSLIGEFMMNGIGHTT